MQKFRMRWLMSAVVVAGTIGFLAGSAFTEDPAAPDEAAMMKMMMELAQPGPAHKYLDAFAGDFDVASSMWISGPEPIVSKASSKSWWVLDGRFVRIEYSGKFKDVAFEGRGIMGYDNHKKAYQILWYDNFGTGLSLETGTLSEDGKTVTFGGEMDTPMGKVGVRHVYTVESHDKFTLTGYAKMGDEETKSMELVFTRKKAAVGRCCPKPTSKGPGY